MNAPIDVTNIRIETDRLILRPWCETDLEDMYAYCSVEGVGEMAGWCHHRSLDETRAILRVFISEKKTFAIELKESGNVIGSLGIEELNPDPIAGVLYGREIGYVLGKNYWGRGLMPEAVSAIIQYCFTVLDYDYLTCCHFTKNRQSQRVIEKCGFQYFGESPFETNYNTVEISKNYLLRNPYKER